MTNPWDGPRHQSWASNTVLMTIVLLALLIATVVTDIIGEPPTYLVGLLGTAAGAFFSALSSDKSKRDADVSRTAHRAEAKADKLGEIAASEHPDVQQVIEQPPFRPPEDDDGGGGGPP